MNKYDSLILFIKDFWGHDLILSEETIIENDLGMAGDDADEFILAFSEKFNVDINDFIFEDYFTRESALCNPIYMWFYKAPSKIDEMTVGKLYEAILTGKLV